MKNLALNLIWIAAPSWAKIFGTSLRPMLLSSSVITSTLTTGWQNVCPCPISRSALTNKLVTTLLQQVPYIILTMDFVPIETEDAYKTLADYRMKVDADKVRFNRKSVDNLDFTANVPQRTQEEENTLNQWQRDMTDNDQQMFLTLLTVAYFADDLEELRQETDALKRRQAIITAVLPRCAGSRKTPLTPQCPMACAALPISGP